MRYIRILGVICMLALLVLQGGLIYAAGNEEPTNTPTPSVAHASAEAMVLVEVNGTVSDKIETDDYLVIGGSFSQVKVNKSTPITRSNVAIVNKKTQALSSWSPVLNGDVYSIAATESHIIITGAFTQVNGEPISHFAVFNISDLTLSEKQYPVNGIVYDADVYDRKTVFLGGSFSIVDEASRTNLASIVIAENRVSSWNPAPNNTVHSVVVDNDLLYVGGEFTNIAGVDRSYIASFYLPSGALSTWDKQAEKPVKTIEIRGEEVLVTSVSEEGGTTTVESIEIDTTPNNISVNTIETVSQEEMDEEATVAGLMIDTEELGFQIPTLADVLTFAIRVFFVIAGLAALFYLLLGAFGWVTSGGDKDSITAARDKIQAAIVGLIMMVVVLALVWTMEQVIFKRRICLGLSCPLTLPSLIDPI